MNRNLFVQEVGQGERVLLILHGLLGTSDNWRVIAKALSSHFRVISIDLRNHGRSFHALPHRMDVMAEDVVRVMDDLKLDKVHLLGHSMGGKVAMQLTDHHPHRIVRLMIIDIALRGNPHEHHLELMQALQAVPLEGIQSRRELDAAFISLVPDLDFRHFLLKSVARDPDRGFFWRHNLAGLCEELPYFLGALSLKKTFSEPTLLLHGTRSKYIGEADISALRVAFPQLTVRALDTGHWPHVEAPADFLRVLERFLLAL